jgi:hypothetical protein
MLGTENSLAPAQVTATTNYYIRKQVISGLNTILKLLD